MRSTSPELLRCLATVEPLEVPAGEVGVVASDPSGTRRAYIPVLSVYLDLRPQIRGSRPAFRPARVLLRERLRQIEQTLWPRGTAFDAVRADAERIEAYLDEAIARNAQGVAIFASTQRSLFETLETERPFENQVSAYAIPDLFQLARLVSDREAAVVAIVTTHVARLFVLQRGSLREVAGRYADSKFYHMVRRMNAMNQAHYQQHALQVRTDFARQVAEQVEQLAVQTGATEILLGGEPEIVPLVREALGPRASRLVRRPPLTLGVDASDETVLNEVAPLLREDEAQQAASVVERLIEAVQADALGVAGLESTQRALALGQVDTLVLAEDGAAEMTPELRSALIADAVKTDADVEVFEQSPLLKRLGGVGALLRYRTDMPAEPNAYSTQAREAPAQQ